VNNEFCFIDPMSRILAKYIEGEELTDGELSQLEVFVDRSPGAAKLFQELTDPLIREKELKNLQEHKAGESENWKKNARKLFPDG
jgi:hypothetical protein